MIKLYHAYKCEFTGRASESADEVRQWEIDAATKIVAASKNVGELRAALKADDESLWRAIRYLDQNKHHIAAPPPKPATPMLEPDPQEFELVSVAPLHAVRGAADA